MCDCQMAPSRYPVKRPYKKLMEKGATSCRPNRGLQQNKRARYDPRSMGNGVEKKSVKVTGHLSSNSGEIVLQWALEGKGIMLRSEWDVQPFLTSGKLVRVLPEYAQSANIWAVYQEPLYRSVKLRVCVEFLAAWCQQRPGRPNEGYQPALTMGSE